MFEAGKETWNLNGLWTEFYELWIKETKKKIVFSH